MDYNEVRKRRAASSGGRNSNGDKKVIIILAIVLAIVIIVGAILIISAIPKKNNDIQDYTVRTTDAAYEPTAQPTVQPTPDPTPIPSKGTMEQIPQDVWASMQGRSWSENPHVGYDDLMYLTMPYYDFNYQVQIGHMIVAADVAEDVLNIFSELFDIQYPIESMEPIDSYFDGLTETFDTPDRNSMGHNNTSCFYYRVVSGSGNLSNHAYGRAIDLNPKTNPWAKGSSVSPRNAVKYAQRALTKAETDFSDWTEVEQAAFIGNDTPVYDIFTKYGWEWGGEIWGAERDYQHFQKRRR